MRRCLSVAAVLALGAALAACGTPEVGPKGKTKRNKEYFAESEYGVKASPRVTNLRTRLPRGGGRDMVGNPYKVRGKWYNPKEEPGYRKTGAASWYGDAFHGRLTANGEIYDMTHLTAAHPTMPLPSYARVTNTANGSSVIVRVNDRGPYSNGRIIDLSKRAAEMLDYHHAGVARVQVEYVGRARMDGRDEQYLVASYRPGGKGARPAIDDGLPSGVMIAMNGATPTSKGDRRIAPPQFPSAPAPVAARPAPAAAPQFPSAPTLVAGVPQPQPASAAPPVALASNAVRPGAQDNVLRLPGDPLYSGGSQPLDTTSWAQRPSTGGINRPDKSVPGVRPLQTASARPMSYADQRIDRASNAFAAISVTGLDETAIVSAWKRGQGAEAAESREYIAAGTFGKRADAERLAAVLSRVGKTRIDADPDSFSVVLTPKDATSLDDLAELAWEAGAGSAFVVRD